MGLHVPACEATLLQLDAGDSGFAGWERVLRESGELLLRTRNDMPGSHKEDIHDVVPDQRKGAGLGYVEIIDAAVDDEMIVLMEPGDLLLFHSHLRHKSTDNNSADKRAAMVYHYAVANTVGHRAFNQDWTEVLRDGAPVEASTAPVPIER